MPGKTARSRRSPRAEERQRDAERSRQALLDAALVEFADKGRAGARVSDIADRAGVNKQLISYYFGGKDGLYDALIERWNRQEEAWSREELPLDELVIRYLQATAEQRDLQRLFVRELLDGVDSGQAGEGDASPELVDLRRRQAGGEIAAELDPALVLLLLQGAVSVGVLFGPDVRRLTGLDPQSPEFVERYGVLLRCVVRGLARPAS